MCKKQLFWARILSETFGWEIHYDPFSFWIPHSVCKLTFFFLPSQEDSLRDSVAQEETVWEQGRRGWLTGMLLQFLVLQVATLTPAVNTLPWNGCGWPHVTKGKWREHAASLALVSLWRPSSDWFYSLCLLIMKREVSLCLLPNGPLGKHTQISLHWYLVLCDLRGDLCPPLTS